MKGSCAALIAAVSLTSVEAMAADYPAPRQGDWIAKDFRFHTGEVMPELKLHYTTVGEPTGQPVLVLHGSGGSAANMLTPTFAGELFGSGQPLDASKYYIIIPDSIGHGQSSKPSDGMRTAFPKYDSYQAASSIVSDQVWTTGCWLMSSMAAKRRSSSSCLEATRIWRGAERASLQKKPSTRLSQEPCFGVKTKMKRPSGCVASHALVSLEMWAE